MSTPPPTTGKEMMAYLAEGAYHETRAEYDADAMAAAFIETYGGPKGREYIEELRHCEIRLDDLWPGWRDKKSWAGLDPDTIAAIKLPLARRRQLLMGAGDWGLRIVWRDSYTPLAVGIAPLREHRDPPPASYYEPHYSAPHLAASTGLPIGVVEDALEVYERGQGVNAREWCLQFAAAIQGGADATEE